MDKYCTYHMKFLCNVSLEDRDLCLDQHWCTSCDNCWFLRDAHQAPTPRRVI